MQQVRISVSAADEIESGLERAIADLYGGRLDDFVRRRDALVKELRSAGKRETAALVKNLRKPTRIAWALDLAAHGNQEALEKLVAAVDQTVAAQTAGGDVRAAVAQLRANVFLIPSSMVRPRGSPTYGS